VLGASVVLGVVGWGSVGPVGDPDTSMCVLRRLTGFPCPTCGMTRSFCAVGRCDLPDAFRHHVLGPPTFLLFAYLAVRSTGIVLAGRTWLERSAGWLVRGLPWIAAAVLVQWGVRIAVMAATGAAGPAWQGSLLGRLFG
jgi:hypothetical protein